MADTNYFNIGPLHVGDYYSEVLRKYLGSLSQTSQFKTSLFLANTTAGESDLLSYLTSCGVLDSQSRTAYDFLCTDAVLPGSILDTASEYGSRQGILERFPTRRNFSDFSLTFYVDSNYQLIRLFEEWLNFINPLYTGSGVLAPSTSGQKDLNTNSFTKFRYPNTYRRNIAISKFERDFYGSARVKGRLQQVPSLTYNFIDAFPLTITPIPLSYEGTTITKTTINFAYSRYVVMKNKGNTTATFAPKTPGNASEVSVAPSQPAAGSSNLGVNENLLDPEAFSNNNLA